MPYDDDRVPSDVIGIGEEKEGNNLPAQKVRPAKAGKGTISTKSGLRGIADLRSLYKNHPERIREVIEEHRGFVSYAADALGTRRQTLSKLIDEKPDLKAFVQGELRGPRVEKAILVLDEIMDDPKHPKRATAAIFTAKTLGKDLGYIERPQDDRSYGVQQHINITVNAPWRTEVETSATEEVVEAEVVEEIEGGEDE
jgi:hypothetical protein